MPYENNLWKTYTALSGRIACINKNDYIIKTVTYRDAVALNNLIFQLSEAVQGEACAEKT